MPASQPLFPTGGRASAARVACRRGPRWWAAGAWATIGVVDCPRAPAAASRGRFYSLISGVLALWELISLTQRCTRRRSPSAGRHAERNASRPRCARAMGRGGLPDANGRATASASDYITADLAAIATATHVDGPATRRWVPSPSVRTGIQDGARARASRQRARGRLGGRPLALGPRRAPRSGGEQATRRADAALGHVTQGRGRRGIGASPSPARDYWAVLGAARGCLPTASTRADGRWHGARRCRQGRRRGWDWCMMPAYAGARRRGGLPMAR